jgi:hypothetical protein
LRIGPPAVDHVYDLGNDAGSVQEQADNPEPPVEQDDEVDALEVSVPVPPSLKKRGRPKGSRNRITDSTPLENRRITRA